MITLINSKKDELLEHFLVNPTKESHLRELSRNTNISLPWIRKNAEELSKKGLVSSTSKHGLVIIKANRDNETYKALKKSYNLFVLYSSGLVEKLVKTYTRPAIILFGSYSRAEDIEDSDIDIAVITKSHIDIDLSSFEKKLSRKIKILELRHDKIEKEFFNTLANGIVLHGYLEVRR